MCCVLFLYHIKVYMYTNNKIKHTMGRRHFHASGASARKAKIGQLPPTSVPLKTLNGAWTKIETSICKLKIKGQSFWFILGSFSKYVENIYKNAFESTLFSFIKYTIISEKKDLGFDIGRKMNFSSKRTYPYFSASFTPHLALCFQTGEPRSSRVISGTPCDFDLNKAKA